MSLFETISSTTPHLKETKKVVVSLSGGLDSTTMLYLMVKQYGRDNVYALSFNYNQRHDIELIQAKKSTQKLGVYHKTLDISFLGEIAKDVSAMVKGSVATPTMEDVLGEPQPSTYMPNRNMILASITAAFAESVGADAIALGIQKVDSYQYWDTCPEFYEAIENILQLNRKHRIYFVAPFLTLSKADEIQLGQELGVPYEDSWTCYNPTAITMDVTYIDEPAGGKNPEYHTTYMPCGVCPSCFEREEAFRSLNLVDPVTLGVRV